MGVLLQRKRVGETQCGSRGEGGGGGRRWLGLEKSLDWVGLKLLLLLLLMMVVVVLLLMMVMVVQMVMVVMLQRHPVVTQPVLG